MPSGENMLCQLKPLPCWSSLTGHPACDYTALPCWPSVPGHPALDTTTIIDIIDNLNLGESHWKDIFVAWFPNKNINLTLAYVDLGRIATINNQTGWYLSTMWYL